MDDVTTISGALRVSFFITGITQVYFLPNFNIMVVQQCHLSRLGYCGQSYGYTTFLFQHDFCSTGLFIDDFNVKPPCMHKIW